MHRFSNNAEGALGAELPDFESVLDMASGDGARFNVSPIDQVTDPAGVGDGSFQAVTLTHDSAPGEYEIIHLKLFEQDTFLTARGQEGTIARAWPAGTKISANVTSGMLDGFVAKSALGKPTVLSLPNADLPAPVVLSDQNIDDAGSTAPTGLAINGQSRMPRTWVIGGHSVLQQAQPFGAVQAERARAYESIGNSVPVDLGVPTPWAQNKQYPRGSVVAPSVANGFQYWPAFKALADEFTLNSVVEPSFPADPYGRAPGGDVAVGFGPVDWMPVAMPVDVGLTMPDSVLLNVTEVGFVCFEYNASAPPVVSIGTPAVPDRFASNVALTDAAGEFYIHRIPVAAGGELVTALRFSVITSAPDGRCRGYFYWKGFMLEPSYMVF